MPSKTICISRVGWHNINMNCRTHQKNEGEHICLKCKKPFCQRCAELTHYSGLCVLCESQKQRRVASRMSQKKTSYISSAIACFIGALAFLAAFLFADGLKTFGIAGMSVLGAAALLFALLFADAAVKNKSASALAARLEEELKKESNHNGEI